MFRKFIHAFGNHNWTLWSNPRPVVTINGLAQAFAGGAVNFTQMRVCRVCHLIDVTQWIALPEGVATEHGWEKLLVSQGIILEDK